MRFYLDASVVVPLLILEPTTAAVISFVEKNSEHLIISDWAGAETASALSRLVRTQRLDEKAARAKLERLDLLRMTGMDEAEVQSSDVRAAALYVRRFESKLRSPDALHLAMTRRLSAALITLDDRLLAAGRLLGVPAQSPLET